MNKRTASLAPQVIAMAATKSITEISSELSLARGTILKILKGSGTTAVIGKRKTVVDLALFRELRSKHTVREMAQIMGKSTSRIWQIIQLHGVHIDTDRRNQQRKAGLEKAKLAKEKVQAKAKAREEAKAARAKLAKEKVEKKNAPVVAGLNLKVGARINPNAEVIFTECTRRTVIETKTDDPRSLFSRPVYNPSAREIGARYAR